jgi:hypothetical protein
MTETRRAVLRLVGVVLTGAFVFACEPPYRVGEYVWVEWDDRVLYPAYVIELKGSRLRVHYEGYDVRWDEDVLPERVKGRIVGPVTNPPPPPARVTREAGALGRLVSAGGSASASASSSGAPAAPLAALYKVGDRVRVRWRGSVYTAQVLELRGATQIKVRYEGHEAAWDEVIDLERVAGKK